nr:Chain A, Alpha-defensin 4 [Mus musculus]
GLLCYCGKGHCKRGERVRGTCGIRFLYCCPRR